MGPLGRLGRLTYTRSPLNTRPFNYRSPVQQRRNSIELIKLDKNRRTNYNLANKKITRLSSKENFEIRITNKQTSKSLDEIKEIVEEFVSVDLQIKKVNTSIEKLEQAIQNNANPAFKKHLQTQKEQLADLKSDQVILLNRFIVQILEAIKSDNIDINKIVNHPKFPLITEELNKSKVEDPIEFFKQQLESLRKDPTAWSKNTAQTLLWEILNTARSNIINWIILGILTLVAFKIKNLKDWWDKEIAEAKIQLDKEIAEAKIQLEDYKKSERNTLREMEATLDILKNTVSGLKNPTQELADKMNEIDKIMNSDVQEWREALYASIDPNSTVEEMEAKKSQLETLGINCHEKLLKLRSECELLAEICKVKNEIITANLELRSVVNLNPDDQMSLYSIMQKYITIRDTYNDTEKNEMLNELKMINSQLLSLKESDANHIPSEKRKFNLGFCTVEF